MMPISKIRCEANSLVDMQVALSTLCRRWGATSFQLVGLGAPSKRAAARLLNANLSGNWFKICTRYVKEPELY
jgi:hypothetical protein